MWLSWYLPRVSLKRKERQRPAGPSERIQCLCREPDGARGYPVAASQGRGEAGCRAALLGPGLQEVVRSERDLPARRPPLLECPDLPFQNPTRLCRQEASKPLPVTRSRLPCI